MSSCHNEELSTQIDLVSRLYMIPKATPEPGSIFL